MIRRLCLDCNEPISAKRLSARPDAEYCVDCQPAHDDPLVAVHDRSVAPEDATNFVLVRKRALPPPPPAHALEDRVFVPDWADRSFRYIQVPKHPRRPQA